MTEERTRQSKLKRLAQRITAGEVVFFIGAGFSLDSEKNTTKTLIARLLARLEALTEILSTGDLGPDAAGLANRLRAGLRKTFGLNAAIKDKPDEYLTASLFHEGCLDQNLNSLAANYYLINDWTCTAFEQLLDALAGLVLPVSLSNTVNEKENAFLQQFRAKVRFSNAAPAPLIDFPWYFQLRTEWNSNPRGYKDLSVLGKVLFLETQGFNTREVMGGIPTDPPQPNGEQLLRPRHHVVARLAAEGLCPTLVTTNYDLLLECAYRDSGMLPALAPENPMIPPNRRYRHFNRIAEASAFITRGDNRGTALIHKIHGCAGTYRDRRSGDRKVFRDFLSTIVFTFREIQNWREDSWSRDYLSTLLRTRTIVFSGYSGADPVLHDTIRTVYEEMSGYVSQGQGQAEGEARAYFFDDDSKRDFYGLAILRAASAAAGRKPEELTDHPNLITFHLGDEPEFPHLDEAYRWLYHLCFRELQSQSLEAELRRVAYQLFDRPCAEEEADKIVKAFAKLREAEDKEAAAFDHSPPADVRRKFARLTAWTQGFHLNLMREFAMAEELVRRQGDRSAIPEMKKRPWYRPVSEHHAWAAWGVVMELAIRRAVCAYQGDPNDWTGNDPYVEAMESDPPTVLFAASPAGARDGRAFVRQAIVVECPAVRGVLNPHARPRQFEALPPRVWELGPAAVPWWSNADKRRRPETPGARQLWKWALGDTRGSETFLEEAASGSQRRTA